MSPTLQFLLALAPILLAGVLLLGFRVAAKRAMPAVYGTALLVAGLAWQIPVAPMAAASLQGLVLAGEILLIVFGAILLLNVLERSGAMAAIRSSFESVSPDRRVQVVVIAWLFGSFIEGAAGFGTPAAIAAPLMVALGFPAACAVMLGMMIQSTAVTFGAVGTPILVGVRGGLDGPEFQQRLTEGNLDMAAYLQEVGVRAATLHGVVGTLMPLLMVLLMTRWFGARRSWREGFAAAPFCLFGGLAFTLPYWLAAVFLGPEFPSLLGSLAGLAVVVPAARRGFLLPRESWDFATADSWPRDWNAVAGLKRERPQAPRALSLPLAWAPYLLVAVLLVLTRIPSLPFGTALKALRFDWPQVLGTGIDIASTPLYLPGAVLILVAVLSLLLHRTPVREGWAATRDAGRTLLGAGFVLLFTVPMVRVYIHSGFNGADLPSMPVAMATWVADHVGVAWPAFAGGVGALGAFLAGSNTVSNLMFSAFQDGVAQQLALSGATIVALQAVGAAAGNMVAIHNVVAALATVGLLGQEGATLRRTILPTLYYLLALAVLGLAAAHWFALPDPLPR